MSSAWDATEPHSAYRHPHLLNLDHRGSPCPAQSVGQQKLCAAVFFDASAGSLITLDSVFEPIADESPAAPLQSIIVIESAILPEKPRWFKKFLQAITFHKLTNRIPIYFYRLTNHSEDAGYEFLGFGMAPESSERLGQALVNDGTMQLHLVPREMNPH